MIECEDFRTVYKDNNIVIGTDDDKIYLTIIGNQTMVRMDEDRFRLLIESIGRYERNYKKFNPTGPN